MGDPRDTDPGHGPDDGDPSNRRESARCLTCHPTYLEQGHGAPDVALILDLSITGAHLLARSPIAIGAPLSLRLLAGEGAAERTVAARVVWVRSRPLELADVWPFEVGVQFDARASELEPTIARLETMAKPIRG